MEPVGGAERPRFAADRTGGELKEEADADEGRAGVVGGDAGGRGREGQPAEERDFENAAWHRKGLSLGGAQPCEHGPDAAGEFARQEWQAGAARRQPREGEVDEDAGDQTVAVGELPPATTASTKLAPSSRL